MAAAQPSRTTVPRVVLASAATLCLIGGVLVYADSGVDPAVQIEQTELYNVDSVPIPLSEGDTISQSFKASDLARIDVKVQSDEPTELQATVLRDGVEAVSRRVPVSAGSPYFLVLTFPIIIGQSAPHTVQFAATEEDAGLRLFGTTGEHFDSGSASFTYRDPQTPMPGFRDIDLGTYTVLSRHDRLLLTRDRLGAYTPEWLQLTSLIALAIVALAALLYLTASIWSRAASSWSIRWTVLISAAVVTIPIATMWLFRFLK